MDKTIFALIPIKFNSTRVPGKNFRLMNGKPLFYYIINTLLKSKYITKIIINIDNKFTEDSIKKYFPSGIDFYYRPTHLEGGHIATNKLFIDMIDTLKLNADYYFQTHTTNPLLKLETIDKAIYQFLNNNLDKEEYDSLYSVKQWQTRLYDIKSNAINHNPNELLPTQDLEPLFEENSCMYLFSKKSITKYNHRIGKNPLMFIMNDIESHDIDIETDFLITESIMRDLYLNLNKIVIVTGVCGGIGYSIAKKFKKFGWTVIGIDINNNESVKELIDELYILNISKEKEILDFVDNITKKYNRVDCIVNNAAHQICKSLYESTSLDWNVTMDTNVKASFLFSKYFRNLLIKTKGSIINISSVHAINTSENISLYAASKGCLSALTRAMALEYGKLGIRVNSILPGAINTEMLRRGLERTNFDKSDINKLSLDEKIEILGKKHCIGHIGDPNDISELVLFLSDNNKSSYIVGQSIIIDGGATIKLSTE